MKSNTNEIRKGDKVKVQGYESEFEVLWVIKRPILKIRCRDPKGVSEYEFPDYKIQEIKKTEK